MPIFQQLGMRNVGSSLGPAFDHIGNGAVREGSALLRVTVDGAKCLVWFELIPGASAR